MPSGRFEISLPEGEWRIVASRFGFRTDTAAITIQSGQSIDFVRVTLRSRPIALRGLTVEGQPSRAFVRTVTTETVRQAPALGEPDVFRALVLLPGVAQPNDLKGRIHLAGGASDETGYRLDGHPLQDPFHLLGLLGSFNVAALDRALIRIHHLPVSAGGRLSGYIDLESRRPEADPKHEVVLGLLSGSYTTVHSGLPGDVDLLASGRVTWLDRVAPVFSPDVPRLGYYDVLVRAGRSWREGWRVEALGFLTQDIFRKGEIKGIDERGPLRWGEAMAGLRLRRTEGRWRVTVRGSMDRATTTLDERPAGEHVVNATRDWWSSAIEVSRHARTWRATAGAALDHRVNRQSWVARGLADEIFSPNMPAVFAGSEEQTSLALFGELAKDLTSQISTAAGVRLSRVGSGWYPAPRVLLTYRASPDLELEGSVGRRFQFDAQLEEPIEGSVSPPMFLLDVPRSADVLAAAAEWHPAALLGDHTVNLRAETFWKRYAHRTLLPRSPEPGRGVSDDFPDFRRIRGQAFGLALSGRLQFSESALLQGSYTYQRARERLGGTWFPTSWDAPHDVSLFGSVSIHDGWILNAAFQARSGRATTPVLARTFEPFPDFMHTLRSRFLLGERNSIRVANYYRLDLGIRHTWGWFEADWTFFFQILNAFASDNPIDYDWLQFFQRQQDGIAAGGGRPGLPFLPSVGVEVKW